VARPRKISDERLTGAAGAVIGRVGPGFTLADVAAEAGVSAGTLVHRFGSRQGLLLAMMRTAIDAEAPAVPDDPVTAIRETLVARYAPLDDAGTAPNHLAQLAADLGDVELRGHLADLHAAIEAQVRALVGKAALPAAPSAAVAARVLTATADGTAIHWSTRPAGSLRRRLRTDLDAILNAWRREPA
jgi:AcrR family transcriptional regulator